MKIAQLKTFHTEIHHETGTRTQRNLFNILLYEPEIRLYLLFSYLFETKRTSVWFQINRKMINAIGFQVHFQ